VAAPLPSLLTVGRIAPSKGHPFLLRVMRYLVHDLGVQATLDIVGKPDHRLAAYHRMLELIVGEYRLEPYVHFHGEIAAGALAARYASASAFVITSEHEGFCVPVIEAMAFGVPVVALGTSAIPETVADAGIVWNERDPRRFAVTLAELIAEPGQRRALGALGRERFEQYFARDVIERRFKEALGAARASAMARPQ
jgi:glycosyltransferase involved in cell wall biosynthesis